MTNVYKEKLTPVGKYFIKGRIIIIPITKSEACELNKKYNVRFGSYGISTTHTKYKRYFLTESEQNMKALNEIRGVKSCGAMPNFRNKRVGV